MEEKTQHAMTKDKILSAEEILNKYSLDYHDGRTYSIEDTIDAMEEYAAQFHPPAMTEEELRDEAEKLYPDSKVSAGYYVRLQREAHIKARKMGATKMDRETAEKIWDACFDHMTEGQYDPGKYPDKETFLNNI